jgi:hypothetical protein
MPSIYINQFDDGDIGNVRAFTSLENAAKDLFDDCADDMRISKDYVCTIALEVNGNAIQPTDVTEEVTRIAKGMIRVIEGESALDRRHNESLRAGSEKL